jgi:hypothetical protein
VKSLRDMTPQLLGRRHRYGAPGRRMYAAGTKSGSGLQARYTRPPTGSPNMEDKKVMLPKDDPKPAGDMPKPDAQPGGMPKPDAQPGGMPKPDAQPGGDMPKPDAQPGGMPKPDAQPGGDSGV